MSAPLAIVGLGPAGLDHVAAGARAVLDDPDRVVVVRTLRHPAAAELARLREVVPCDDLYDEAEDLDAVYDAIADRVLGLLDEGPVVYAVPGSVGFGERAAAAIVARAATRGVEVASFPGVSFLDLALPLVGVDAVADGVQVVDGRDLPDPLPLHVPTFVTQVDSALVVADVAVALGRRLDDGDEVVVLSRLGSADEEIRRVTLGELPRIDVDERTTLYVAPRPVGLLGLVAVNRRLRRECPWDARQTHHSLATHLLEEAYETLHALAALPPDAPAGEADFGAYAAVEEELGDLLLQVVFHATLAAEAGAFDVDDVAEQIRRKLVRRHPHVFGDLEVADAAEVKANWEQIKAEEKDRASLMDDVPQTLPGILRADKLQRRAAAVGFDWEDAEPIFEVLATEIDELAAARGDPDAELDELGDVLFTVVNLARHLGVDPEIALVRAAERFSSRFRAMERLARDRGVELRDLGGDDLEELWETAKAAGS